ncbi:PIG-L deacetylase family protein [Mycolicibacterium stellerae]|uniref:PIG-L deacetylase family protein n=1 Tax=Mycolicibacterium stellerae TaxID=2358193 RepID=UPI0019D0E022|nr:PIG-L family deacetylase [Mycolicibacterium stellerae]
MSVSSGTAGRAPVLMAVHAHPDDESSQTGGTLARYSAAGYRTILVTCTDGACGDGPGGVKPGAPEHDPRIVARIRSKELDAATAALGINQVVKLGYRDSGVPSDTGSDTTTALHGDPWSYRRRAFRPLVTQMLQLLHAYRPQVLITYPPNGLSGHPDHIRVHEVVTAAHRQLITGRAPDSPEPASPWLYHIALSRSRLAVVQDAVRAASGPDAWVPPEAMAVEDLDITAAIDVSAFWDNKIAALKAHASQPDAASLLKVFSNFSGPASLSMRVEEYVRVWPPTSGVVPRQHDLFDLHAAHADRGTT